MILAVELNSVEFEVLGKAVDPEPWPVPAQNGVEIEVLGKTVDPKREYVLFLLDKDLFRLGDNKPVVTGNLAQALSDYFDTLLDKAMRERWARGMPNVDLSAPISEQDSILSQIKDVADDVASYLHSLTGIELFVINPRPVRDKSGLKMQLPMLGFGCQP